jgi:hypothetical protein
MKGKRGKKEKGKEKGKAKEKEEEKDDIFSPISHVEEKPREMKNIDEKIKEVDEKIKEVGKEFKVVDEKNQGMIKEANGKIEELLNKLDALDPVDPRWNAIQKRIDSLEIEKSSLVKKENALVKEKNSLVKEKNSLVKEKNSLLEERKLYLDERRILIQKQGTSQSSRGKSASSSSVSVGSQNSRAKFVSYCAELSKTNVKLFNGTEDFDFRIDNLKVFTTHDLVKLFDCNPDKLIKICVDGKETDPTFDFTSTIVGNSERALQNQLLSNLSRACGVDTHNSSCSLPIWLPPRIGESGSNMMKSTARPDLTSTARYLLFEVKQDDVCDCCKNIIILLTIF